MAIAMAAGAPRTSIRGLERIGIEPLPQNE